MITAAVDARRGEVFHATYRSVPGGVQRISEPAVGQPEEPDRRSWLRPLMY